MGAIEVSSTIRRVEHSVWRVEGSSGNLLVVQPSASQPGRFMIDSVSPEGQVASLGTHADAETAVLFAVDVAEEQLFLSRRLTPELLDGRIRLDFSD